MDNAEIKQQLAASLALDGIDYNEIVDKVEHPEKYKKKIKHPLRKRFFIVFSSITYGFFVYNLFWKQELILSLILFCIFFIELIFLSIDLRNERKRILRTILLITWWILRLFIPNPIRQLVVSLRISLITIGYLIVSLRGYFKNVRKINWFVYFSKGAYIFTLMTTILFWFAILWINTKFPFECNQISSLNENIIKKSTSSFLFGNFDDEKTVFDLKREIEEIQGLTDEEQNVLKEARTNLKTNTMEGFLETKNSINSKICETVIEQINQVYQNPVFQVGVIFWIYLLFYGVFRIVVRCVIIVGYVVFFVVKLFWGYKVEKLRDIVEEVE